MSAEWMNSAVKVEKYNSICQKVKNNWDIRGKQSWNEYFWNQKIYKRQHSLCLICNIYLFIHLFIGAED